MLMRCAPGLHRAVSGILGLLVALAVGSANAALYRGFADPQFGATIDGNNSGNLGWRLNFIIDIPDAPNCFALNVSPSSDCVSGAKFTDATLTFYDYPAGGDLAEVTWNAAALAGVNIYGIKDNGSEPTQLKTAFFPDKLATGLGGFDSSDDGAYGNFLDVLWSVGFSFNFKHSDYAGPVLRWTTVCDDKGCRQVCEVDIGYNNFRNPAYQPTTFQFTQVPEPGTLVLIGASLIAALGLRRRPFSRKWTG